MASRCSRCGRTFDERKLRPQMGVRAACPWCGNPVELPAATMPFVDQAVVNTMESPSQAAGFLCDNKRYAVVVLEGKGRGQVFPVAKPRVTIGRIQCDINLNDTEVSRQHALLSVHGMEATIEDLGSTNGTYVGEAQVREAGLDNRSEFRIGNHHLMFVIADRDTDLR